MSRRSSIVRTLAGLALTASLSFGGLTAVAPSAGADPVTQRACEALKPTVATGDATPFCFTDITECPDPGTGPCNARATGTASTTSGPAALTVSVVPVFTVPGLPFYVYGNQMSRSCSAPLGALYPIPAPPRSCTTTIAVRRSSVVAPPDGFFGTPRFVGYSATCRFDRVGTGGPTITDAVVRCEIGTV